MPNNADSLIIDGAVVVNMVRPRPERTFSEYATQSFLPYVQAQLLHVQRVDVVWDEYLPTSLKTTTRQQRGQGTRRCVLPNSPLPRNWQTFLRLDQNKMELFRFLAQCIAGLGCQKQIITTHGKDILATLPREDTSALAPCTQEEADTRIFLHAADAIQHGYSKVPYSIYLF